MGIKIADYGAADAGDSVSPIHLSHPVADRQASLTLEMGMLQTICLSVPFSALQGIRKADANACVSCHGHERGQQQQGGRKHAATPNCKRTSIGERVRERAHVLLPCRFPRSMLVRPRQHRLGIVLAPERHVSSHSLYSWRQLTMCTAVGTPSEPKSGLSVSGKRGTNANSNFLK